jgi:hypothetical protein
MDIVEFEKNRQLRLNDFVHDYDSLKLKYNSLLSDAVYETDPQKQAELLNSILQVNSELASEVRAFIAKSGDSDPKTVDNLTNRLIELQKEYDDIKKSNDLAETAKRLHSQTKTTLDSTVTEYNIYLGAIIFAIFVILMLIFHTSISSWFSSSTVVQAGGKLLLKRR